jgi:hypothetical protein
MSSVKLTQVSHQGVTPECEYTSCTFVHHLMGHSQQHATRLEQGGTTEHSG